MKIIFRVRLFVSFSFFLSLFFLFVFRSTRKATHVEKGRRPSRLHFPSPGNSNDTLRSHNFDRLNRLDETSQPNYSSHQNGANHFFNKVPVPYFPQSEPFSCPISLTRLWEQPSVDFISTSSGEVGREGVKSASSNAIKLIKITEQG